jgi:hypothetical protein
VLNRYGDDGRDDTAINVGSLREWAADPELPLEAG